MKLWITGGRGLLGSALKELCQEQKISYVATDRAQVDVANKETVARFAQANRPTHIINCAAYTAVDLAEKEQETAFAVNAEGPAHLARVAKKQNLPLIHISTNYVFDGRRSTPYVETDACNPINVYGASKLEGEKRLLTEYPEACIIRTSWLFGKGGKNFISSILETLKKERSMRACEDQYGKATYSRDLAEAIFALFGKSGIFHFANNETVSRYRAACDIKAEAEKRGIPLACEEIIPAPASDFVLPAVRPMCALLATDKIEVLLPVRAWKTVLSEYLNHAK